MRVIFACFCVLMGFQVAADESVIVESLGLSSVEIESQVLAKTFVRHGAVYSYSSNFRCDYRYENKAMQTAADAATSDCYEAGFNSCQVMSVIIVQSGYLGYRPEFQKDLGYGCLAKAVVRGN